MCTKKTCNRTTNSEGNIYHLYTKWCFFPKIEILTGDTGAMSAGTIVAIALVAIILIALIAFLLYYYFIKKRGVELNSIFRRQQIYDECPDSSKRLSLLGKQYESHKDFIAEGTSHKTSMKSDQFHETILEVRISN